MFIQPKLGKLIRLCRKQAGLTQIELAQIASVGKTVIFDLEKGKESVQLDTLGKILTTLNIQLKIIPPVEFLQEGDDV